MAKYPLILVTMGDPNGVGPEIAVKLWGAQSLPKGGRFVLVGDPAVAEKGCSLYAPHLRVIPLSSLTDLDDRTENDPDALPVWSGGVSGAGEAVPGKVDGKAGAAAIGWVRAAVEAIRSGRADGMVTAPLSKEAVELTVPGFTGHTEYIGALCGDPEPVLSLFHGDWVVAHVSTHVSLREACDRVTVPRILKTGRLLDRALRKIGITSPRIGIAGLNPHAGESGLFGREEIEVISPATEQLRSEGIDAVGPLPADVVFPQMKAGRFDGVVAMYHDQGHVVTKTIGFELGENRLLRGVNATLGLDLVRTSVDHGTGFDIAWNGIADYHSLLDAAELALRMVSPR